MLLASPYVTASHSKPMDFKRNPDGIQKAYASLVVRHHFLFIEIALSTDPTSKLGVFFFVDVWNISTAILVFGFVLN